MDERNRSFLKIKSKNPVKSCEDFLVKLRKKRAYHRFNQKRKELFGFDTRDGCENEDLGDKFTEYKAYALQIKENLIYQKAELIELDLNEFDSTFEEIVEAGDQYLIKNKNDDSTFTRFYQSLVKFYILLDLWTTSDSIADGSLLELEHVHKYISTFTGMLRTVDINQSSSSTISTKNLIVNLLNICLRIFGILLKISSCSKSGIDLYESRLFESMEWIDMFLDSNWNPKHSYISWESSHRMLDYMFTILANSMKDWGPNIVDVADIDYILIKIHWILSRSKAVIK